jgi:hypothetical protein
METAGELSSYFTQCIAVYRKEKNCRCVKATFSPVHRSLYTLNYGLTSGDTDLIFSYLKKFSSKDHI